MTGRHGSWAAAALYLGLTLLLAYPLSVTAHRTLPSDDPDGHLFMWTLAWDAHAFVHQPLSVFDANTFYPNRHTLAYSENLIGSAFFAAPVLWLTGNPVLAVNVVSLLSCMLCGLGAYVLGRRVGLSAPAALLTGIVFAFSPPRFLRFSQLHLAPVQWIPFALASLHVYFDRGRARDLRLAIAFFTLQVLASGHGGVFAAVAILLMVVYRLALGEPVLLMKRLRDFGVAGVLLLIPVVLIAIPYRINQMEVGLRRTLDAYGTPLRNFLASPTRVDTFLRSLVTSNDPNRRATAWLFPGLVPILLSLVAVAGGAITLITRLKRPATLRPYSSVWLETVNQYRVPLLAFLIAVVSWALLGVIPSLLRPAAGLTPQAYGNDRLAWTGYLNIEQAGRYDFRVTSDDGSRLSIDDQLIIDRRSGQPDAPITGAVPLISGSHRIFLEQRQRGGPSGFNLAWAREGEGGDFQPVPARALSQRPISDSAWTIIRALAWLRVTSAIVAGPVALWCVSGWLVRRREAWTEWGARFRRSPTGFYLLLTVVSVGLSLGGRSGLWQFVYWLPGFNFIREPSRFMVLGLLGVAILAGVGFDRLTARLAAPRRRLAAVVSGGLLIAEFSTIPFRGTPYRIDIPAADRWLAGQQTPFSVAEVPVAASDRYHSNYMLHSMAHWQRTVHGFSGILPALHEELYKQLESFPSEESVRHLAQLDVTYVIVHNNWFSPEERRLIEERLLRFSSSLTLEYQDPDSRVYSVHRP
jgi:PA14 domain-containing protein